MKWNNERRDFVIAVTTVTVIFVLMKMFGLFTLSWWLVLSPLYVPLIFVGIVKLWFEYLIKGI